MKRNVRKGQWSHVSPELFNLRGKCMPVGSPKWIYVSGSK